VRPKRKTNGPCLTFCGIPRDEDEKEEEEEEGGAGGGEEGADEEEEATGAGTAVVEEEEGGCWPLLLAPRTSANRQRGHRVCLLALQSSCRVNRISGWADGWMGGLRYGWMGDGFG